MRERGLSGGCGEEERAERAGERGDRWGSGVVVSTAERRRWGGAVLGVWWPSGLSCAGGCLAVLAVLATTELLAGWPDKRLAGREGRRAASEAFDAGSGGKVGLRARGSG
ncbi:uncharacterized protein A4U43_C03F28600 [Asparagus officinalis]|uniref:Uncharacterized protein n=1 Tax=Asparagus officinalis TaxID=4686 RepID=A0A5P1FDP7_ASPOF|nr:uncharacterized protein A4U43_C03F28600 [Asparagus officinalis]